MPPRFSSEESAPEDGKEAKSSKTTKKATKEKPGSKKRQRKHEDEDEDEEEDPDQDNQALPGWGDDDDEDEGDTFGLDLKGILNVPGEKGSKPSKRPATKKGGTKRPASRKRDEAPLHEIACFYQPSFPDCFTIPLSAWLCEVLPFYNMIEDKEFILDKSWSEEQPLPGEIFLIAKQADLFGHALCLELKILMVAASLRDPQHHEQVAADPYLKMNAVEEFMPSYLDTLPDATFTSYETEHGEGPVEPGQGMLDNTFRGLDFEGGHHDHVSMSLALTTSSPTCFQKPTPGMQLPILG